MKTDKIDSTGTHAKCLFFLIMSYISVAFLGILNFYIGYTVIKYFKGDGWSFLGGLFVAFSFIITIPALIFSWKSINWIKEDKKHKHIFLVILGILGVLISLILHNATGLWIYILIYSTLLLLSNLICKKKTNNITPIILLLVFSLTHTAGLYAQNNNKIQEINLLTTNTDDYVGFYATDINDFYHPEKSSRYPSTNLFDGYFQTCWVTGSYKTKSYDTLYVRFPKEIYLDKIILNIFSGYGKNKTLYYQNARPKKIKISIYAAYNPDGYATEVADKYFIKKYSVKLIELKDTFGVQSFPLNLNKQKLIDFQQKNLNNYKSFIENKDIKTTARSFILKVEIVAAYKGSKYDDVCISELFFNNRFVTPYPLKYNEVKNVYIKNDNTLLVDYANEKAVVIYKDTSSVFTMIDWVQNANYALLHYVPNDEVGPSRIEEYCSLVDLKNRKIVDKEFEKCTGYNPSFGIIEKKDGQVFIENISKYGIELK